MRISALFLALVLACPAFADSPRRAITAESTGSYALDKTHASIIFSIKHLGFSDYIGRFNDFDAALELNGTDPTKSQLTVTVKPGSADTHNPELEAKLDGENYFNIAQHPEVKFVSTEIKVTARGRGTVKGDLTMLGITKPVTLNVTLNGAGINSYANAYTVGFSATATIKRSDWGMKTLIPQVSDEVQLIISAEFNKRGATETAPATPAAR